MLRAYECSVRGTDWHRTVHAESAGKAKSEYWRDVTEPWPDVPFTAVTCRVIGGPVTSDAFRRTAEYRGVPFARVGMRVQAGEWHGVIVGNNDSANFDVLFEDGPFKGQKGNCHPNYQMRYFDRSGQEITGDKAGL